MVFCVKTKSHYLSLSCHCKQLCFTWSHTCSCKHLFHVMLMSSPFHCMLSAMSIIAMLAKYLVKLHANFDLDVYNWEKLTLFKRFDLCFLLRLLYYGLTLKDYKMRSMATRHKAQWSIETLYVIGYIKLVVIMTCIISYIVNILISNKCIVWGRELETWKEECLVWIESSLTWY